MKAELVDDDTFELSFVYSRALHDATTIEQLAKLTLDCPGRADRFLLVGDHPVGSSRPTVNRASKPPASGRACRGSTATVSMSKAYMVPNHS